MRFGDRLRQERRQRHLSQEALAQALGCDPKTINRWERHQAIPQLSSRLQISRFFGIHPDELFAELDESASPAFLWLVPYPRNPHFTGRDDLLEQLARQLSLPQEQEGTMTRRAILSQPQAIKGLGGIGKTQIAVEYAYRARLQGRYTHTLWINAASQEAILTSFQALAKQLPDFPARDEKDQHKLISAILDWLEACSQPWLLIVDNADELSLVQPYLPQHGQGSILLTTRAQAVGWLANSLEVEQMGVIEGTQFLLRRSQRLQASDEESNEASNVVIALDGFPLALDQAGAYIEETGCRFGDYLQLYEQHRARLLARRGKQATNYPASVATTWSLSLQQVEQASPVAVELLRLCAFLSPDHIPEELITRGALHWPPLLQKAVSDPLSFNEVLEALLAFSLVKRLAEEHLLSLHRLVQAVQIDQMEIQLQRQWAQRLVYVVNELFPADPKDEVETWPQCLRYLEQVQACDRLIQQHQLLLPEAARLLDRAGVYLREHASYSVAEPLFRRALAIAEQHEPEQLQVASSLYNLGDLYREQGKYELAEPLLQRALRVREQALDSDHPQLAFPLTNLGMLYKEQGKYELAEPLYRRALHIREQALGPDHPQLASSLNNLGILYREQGKYELAEPLYQRALHIREQTLGSDHPQLASPFTNLGNLYRDQGKYMLAESCHQRALHICERTLSPDHPHVAYPLNNLGLLYSEQGKYEQAEPLLQRALRIREQAQGPDHPQLAIPLTNLGDLYGEQDKYEQAEVLFQRALHILEQALGLHHPHVAYPLNSLANLCRKQGQYEQAEVLYQRALSLRRDHQDAQPLELAETLLDLAQLREMQQRTEAHTLYQQALAIREQVLGAQHPKTADARKHLCRVLQTMGKTEEAALLQSGEERVKSKSEEGVD